LSDCHTARWTAQGWAQVRKHADKALDTLLDRHPGQAAVIQELKFKTFNHEWLQVVEEHIDDARAAVGSLGAAGGMPAESPDEHDDLSRTLLGLYDDDHEEVRLLDMQAAGAESPVPGGGGSGGVGGSVGAAEQGPVEMPADEASDSGSDIMQNYV
jgi:hypothetical protein